MPAQAAQSNQNHGARPGQTPGGTGASPTGGMHDALRGQGNLAAQQAMVSPDGPTVTVKPGDTLSAIAQRELGNPARWPDIAKLNRLNGGTPLRPGQKLRMPAGATAQRPAAIPPTTPPQDRDASPDPPAEVSAPAPKPAAADAGRAPAPDKGKITFDAEGSADTRSPYYSRRLHWPGSASGVTIGRGYDLKERREKEAVAHLTMAGVAENVAIRIAKGCKLSGKAAERFVRANRDVEITADSEVNLFKQVYDEKEVYAADCVKRWSNTDWHGLSQPMKDVIVDLFYRGDLTRNKWIKLKMAEVAESNNMTSMMQLLFDRSNWSNIDTNRYIARMDATADAIAGNRPGEQIA